MAAVIIGNGYRVTVSRFSDAYRAEYIKDGDTVGSFRWCDNTTEVAELLEELEWCD